MSIIFNKKTKIFYLEGKNVTYSFFVNNSGYLEHLYFGEKIDRDDIRYTALEGRNSFEAMPHGKCFYNLKNPEISFFGVGDYKEPTVQVQNPEGDRISELLFEDYEILNEKPKIKGMPSMTGSQTLIVHLKDFVTDFAADLYYTDYGDADVIARRL